MKRKRLSRAVFIAALALIITLISPLTGCATNGVSFPTASPSLSLSQATTCESVNPETEEPVGKTDTFSPDTPEIFCSVKLSNAPSNTAISAEWRYVQTEAGGENYLLIDTWNRIAEGTRYISASITRPGAGWPEGNYQLHLSLNGQEASTVSFKVQ